MSIEKLPIYAYYNKQRFIQAGSMDCANWYGVQIPDGKEGQALYPAMGRKHVEFLGENKLIFDSPPRFIYRSINFVYVVVGSQVYKIDKNFQQTQITTFGLELNSGADVWFAYLTVQTNVYSAFTDGEHIYIYDEDNETWQLASGTGVDGVITAPEFIAAFGNRFVVNNKDSTQFFLSNTNLGATPTNPATWFNVASVAGGSLFNSASGVIKQIVTLHNQLYIFNDFSCDVWSNIPTQITVANATFTFPFKLNTSYNFDYGMADPHSLSVDFGMMAWLAQNTNGLVSFVISTGQMPQDISSQAINVLLEASTSVEGLSPFLTNNSEGFLYQYENTIFYRVSAGKFLDFGDLDIIDSANSLEYNFETKTWARVIELNGERNRIQSHVFFSNKHLVTVEDDVALYQMAGNIYFNETRNPDQEDPQAVDAFLKFPMRYELITQQIFQPDYSEFITDYVEIDFVFGDQTFYKSNAPFDNTIYIVDEASTEESPIYLVTEDSTPGNETFIIAEEGNTPQFSDDHYNALFKPHIELYWSDDGGVTFQSADLREFSPLGFYRWRMRWYQLGPSRNRCYKLICVSSAPIVVLGGCMNVRRASGGAN